MTDKDKTTALTGALEGHHAELANLSQQIERLEHQKAMIRGAAIVGLASQSEALGLPKEAIGSLIASCW